MLPWEGRIITPRTPLGKCLAKEYTPPMATKKKTPAKPKAPAKKSAARPKTAKSAARKPATKAKKTSSKPAGPREQKLASSALKLVDEAAALLRRGITTGADISEKNRLEAKKRAHNLLNKATSSLSSLLESGSSVISKAISKI